MKQFAIIGLSNFGQRMLEELLGSSAEILIIDKDREIIDMYKDQVASSYVADVLKEETIRKIIPEDIDAVIIDLGDRIEASILLVNYLKKMGVKKIIAKAETEEHGEILGIVGAHQVVFPNREAARRVAPPLVLSTVFNYMPISKGLVMAEVGVPRRLAGKSLIEADLRKNNRVNAIAVSRTGSEEYEFVSPTYIFNEEDILLVVGREEDIGTFSSTSLAKAGSRDIVSVVRRFLGRGKSRREKTAHPKPQIDTE
ncbi:MAG TPA: TrkA family potassium uptake protein [Spirochaetia bacterium]|nr:TrkA family potassium uptake protein [Spirochaetia bacterium]